MYLASVAVLVLTLVCSQLTSAQLTEPLSAFVRAASKNNYHDCFVQVIVLQDLDRWNFYRVTNFKISLSVEIQKNGV